MVMFAAPQSVILNCIVLPVIRATLMELVLRRRQCALRLANHVLTMDSVATSSPTMGIAPTSPTMARSVPTSV
jgi:hypothetical protein